MKILSVEIKKISCFFAFFAASLSLTSPYGALLSWVILPCVVFILSVNIKLNLWKNIIFILGCFLLLVTSYFSYEVSIYRERYLLNISLVIFGLMFSLYSINKSNIDGLVFLIDKIILVNVILFLIQFFSHYVFNENIDYNMLTGGAGSRNEWGTLYRASGVYDEPAVFCMHMTGLIVLRWIISKENIIFCNLALICMCLSFSFVGILQAFSLFVLMGNSFKSKKIILMIVFLFVFFIYFYDNFEERFLQFLNGDDGSNNTKIDVIKEFLSDENLIKYGYGFVGYRSDYPLHYQGIYDLTFFGANFTIYGIFFGSIINMAFFFLIAKSKFSIKEVLMIFVALIKISTPTFMIYWFFIVTLFFINKNRLCSQRNTVEKLSLPH